MTIEPIATRLLFTVVALTGVSGMVLAAATNITFGTARSELSDFEFWKTGEGPQGEWSVVKDETAGETQHALEQTSRDKTDYRFPLAIYKPFDGKDVEATVRFKAMAGSVDQAGGVAVRLQTAGHYYVARANALENNVRFYRVIDGKREMIAGADAPVPAQVWHTLGLRAKGDNFTVIFNGKELYSAEDHALPRSGRVALWTKADSITRFGNIAIQPLD